MNLRNIIPLCAVASRAKAIHCLAGISLVLVTSANAATDHKTLAMGNRPLSFESNIGQYDGAAQFVSRGPAYYLSLSPTEVLVTVRKVEKSDGEESTLPRQIISHTSTIHYRTLRVELLDANPSATLSGVGEISSIANYFIGSNASKWRTGVPAFDRVRVADVYPGINLIHYGNQNHLEYDFEVAPDADPSAIAMRFTGADKIAVDSTGELVLTLGGEEIRQPKPVIFQTINGERKLIAGSYVLTNANTVTFALGDYDHSLALVIDPIVSYIVLEGGESDETLWAVATDAQGNIFAAGETTSVSILGASTIAFQTNLAGAYAGHGDVLLQKMANLPTTNYQVTYSTYLGGSFDDTAFGLAVDAEGNAYVAGYTGSANFPTRNPVQTNIAGTITPGIGRPPLDGFVAKVGPRGTNLIFSTFFGGSKDDAALSIALDSNTNICVVGFTLSTNFPVVNILLSTNTVGTNVVITTNSLAGFEDAFAFKLSAAGTNVIYSRYLGGAGRDYATSVVTDSNDQSIVVGYTSSSLFPTTTNAVQALFNRTTNSTFAFDAFVTALSSTNATINYSTYLGGAGDDFAFNSTRDNSGAICIVGSSSSTDFPRTSTNLYSSMITNALLSDAFAVKLNPSLTNLDYSVTFGGTGKDEAWDIAVDSAGRAHIVGVTLSANFPPTNVFGLLRATNSGASDAFIAELNSTGTALNYSAYIGGVANDAAYGVAVDAGGNTYVTGVAEGSTFPTQPPTGFTFTDKDGFILKILANPTLAIAPAGTNVELTWLGFGKEFTLQSTTNLAVTNAWITVTNIATLTNNHTAVTIPSTNPAKYFRLKK